jgi:hypothetical protein
MQDSTGSSPSQHGLHSLRSSSKRTRNKVGRSERSGLALPPTGGEVVPGPNIDYSDDGDVLIPVRVVVSVSQVMQRLPSSATSLASAAPPRALEIYRATGIRRRPRSRETTIVANPRV